MVSWSVIRIYCQIYFRLYVGEAAMDPSTEFHKDSDLATVKKPSKPANMRRWCLYYGIAASVILVLLFILMIVFIALYAQANNAASSSQSSGGSSVCLTVPCVDLASVVANNMDENIDPCEDFYNFSCGNYGKTRGKCPLDDSLCVQLVIYRGVKK